MHHARFPSVCTPSRSPSNHLRLAVCGAPLLGWLALIGLLLNLAAPAAEAVDAGEAFFEREVRPILVAKCQKCHGAQKQESGLRLDNREMALRGGDRGPSLVAGDPVASLLLRAVRHEGDLKMPSDKKLTVAEIESLTAWIKQGAPWPATKATITTRGGVITAEERNLWSLQPLKTSPIPPVRDSAWPLAAIDNFLLAPLEAAGLAPAPPADPRTWLRRATFDLTGLPPTPEEAADLLVDDSPDAHERIIDRLLASPAYGERWGRHWLDVARYADTAGETADYPIPQAYLYRNYVLRSLDADKPYDQFIREQIAGDLLAADEANISPRRYEELVTATGFIALSRRFGFDPENYQHLTIQDTIDTTGQAVLGLSLGCARCHDHKFDPVNMGDYYGLFGIFQSTRYAFPGSEEKKRPRDFPPAVPAADTQRLAQAHQAQLAEIEAALQKLAGEQKQLAGEKPLLAARLKMLEKPTSPTPNIPHLPLVQSRLLNKSVRDADGRVGVSVWKVAETPEPVVVANATTETLKTPATLPSKSIIIHPPVRGGVAVGWRSPIEADVLVKGQVSHAHGDCGGDGVAWYIDHLFNGGDAPLASGQFDARGQQAFAQGAGAEKLQRVHVRVGDILQLVVLPRQNHGCDSTLAELRIEELDGQKRVWSFTGDCAANLLEDGQGNPHSDGYGNADVWFFYSTLEDRGLIGDLAALPSDPAEIKLRLARIDAQLPALQAEQQRLTRQRDELASRGPYLVIYGAADGEASDAKIQLRGEPLRPGNSTPRRFLEVLGGDPLPTTEKGSGRRELASWLTRADNPLTPRVIVNRLWQHHFGEGLVRTENDFGQRGQRPTHPELLDQLAVRLRESGWSLKWLHRRLMNSQAYRQSTRTSGEAARVDPENRLLSHFSSRRLTAEEIRDSLLAVCGGLDRGPGGEHPFPPVNTWGFTQHAPFLAVYPSNRRSVYLMTQRLKRHPFLALFDGADTGASTAQRDSTTVPTQSLFLMNDPLVHEQSLLLAQELAKETSSPAARLPRLYERALNRLPTEAEAQRSERFLHDYAAQLTAQGQPAAQADLAALAALCRTVLIRNEFLFVD